MLHLFFIFLWQLGFSSRRKHPLDCLAYTIRFIVYIFIKPEKKWSTLLFTSYKQAFWPPTKNMKNMKNMKILILNDEI